MKNEATLPLQEEKPKKRTRKNTRSDLQGSSNHQKGSGTETKTLPPPPPLSTTWGPLIVVFEGQGEVISDHIGAIPIGKRLLMAYAEMNRGKSMVQMIANKPEEAFEIVSFNPKTDEIVVTLKNVETMSFTSPDQNYVAKMLPQETIPKEKEVHLVRYGLLARMTRLGDCPYCLAYVGSRSLVWMKTDQGHERVACCSSCGHMMRSN